MINFFLGPGIFRLFLATVVFAHHLSRINIGNSAVLVFFFLSGYWVSKMYEEKYYLTKNSIITFYISRILRIFPIFVLSTALFLIFDFILNLDYMNYEKLIWFPNFILFGWNFFEKENAILVQAWSLNVELIFYLILPLILYIKNYIINILVSFLIFILFIYDYFFFTGKIFYGYFIFFLLGIYLYNFQINISKFKGILSILIFFTVIILFLFVDKEINPMTGGSDPSIFFMKYNKFFNLFIAFLLIPFAIITLNPKKICKIDRFFGDMSYPLYLIHSITVTFVSKYKDINFFERFFYVIIAVIFTYILCALITQYYDFYFEKIRKNIYLKSFK